MTFRSSGALGAEPRSVTLSPWQEVQGTVREVADEGPRIRIVLEDGPDVVQIRVAAPLRGAVVRVGERIAILRTDEPGREFVVRTLG